MGSVNKKPNRALLVDVFLVLVLLCGCFIVEGHSYFDGTRQGEMTNVQMILSCLGYVLLFVGFILTSKRHVDFEIKAWPLLVFVGLLFVNLFAILFFPGVYDTGELIYQIDAAMKFRYCLYALVICSMLYLLFVLAPQQLAGSKIFDIVLFVTVIIVILAVFFSYFKEADLYRAILDNGGADETTGTPKSWTTQKNVYAFMLFNGLVAEAYFEAKNPHWWRWIILVFLYFNQFFVLSKTILAVSTLFLIGFYFWHFVKTLPTHRRRNWIILGVLFVGLGSFLLFGLLYPEAFWLNHYFHTIWNFMLAYLGTTFLDRVYVWSDVARCISSFPLTIMVGVGYGNWIHVFYSYLLNDPNGFYPVDSAWVVDLARGGVIGILFSVVVDAYVLFLIVDALKKHKKTAMVSLLYALGLFFRSFVEAGDLAFPDSFGVIYNILLVMPLAADRFAEKHPSSQSYVTSLFTDPERPSLPRQPFSSERFLKKSLAFSLPLCLDVPLFLEAWGILNGNDYLANPNLFFAFGSVMLVAPFIFLALASLVRGKHIYGFICLLFWFIVAMVMAFALPSISGDWLGALFPVLMAFVLLLIVCFSGIIPGEKIFAKTASIYFFVGLSILLTCHFALVSNPRSMYLTLVALALPIIVSIFLSSFASLSWDDWSLAKWSDRYLLLQERYALKGDVQRSRVFTKGVSHGKEN